jgi:hypothetical protein
MDFGSSLPLGLFGSAVVACRRFGVSVSCQLGNCHHVHAPIQQFTDEGVLEVLDPRLLCPLLPQIVTPLSWLDPYHG